MDLVGFIGIEQSAVIGAGLTRSLILPVEPAFVDFVPNIHICLNDLQEC